MKLFELTHGFENRNRWYLSVPEFADQKGVPVGTFANGIEVPINSTISFTKNKEGDSLPFTISTFGVPIVTEKVVSVIEHLITDCCQIIPVTIPDTNDPYFILNFTRQIDCINEEQTHTRRYTATNARIPERIGKYRDVSGMHLRTDIEYPYHAFRVAGWTVVLMVSEPLKELLETHARGGISFVEIPFAK
jgi:hypothetical protein